jgi:3-oxoacyl-(acyl-carrier-protein) synthase/pimeloyl-ACP methyl ester carboxylesterase
MINNQEKIALVGMACRLPDAKTVNEFWQNLLQGRISTKKNRRWSDGNQALSGFLDDPNHFDAAFFNISPNEAQCMSPQLRQLLEVSYQAIESSGLTIKKLGELNTGVFCTGLPGDYKNLLAQDKHDAINPYSFSGNAPSAMSGRLSYYYDFHGPSISIDTACSSGLTALHLAQLSIKNGDCEAALVGGASLFSTSEFHTLATASQMLSNAHECAAFDEKADGFVASEGIVCLLLIRESKAKELGLPIYGLIKEIKLNHNGLSNGLMAPNAKQQESLIKKTYQQAGLSLKDIALFETHGTATKLGDSIELRGLSNALVSEENTSACYLGASKMIIGHCLVSSALASVIKVALSYHYKIIPPNPLFKTLNPLLTIPEGLVINTTPVPWPKEKQYASISAYGFTGSNGHLIMEFVEPSPPVFEPYEYQHYFLISAASLDSLTQLLSDLSSWLAEHPDCSLDAFSIRLLRRPLTMKYRLAVYAKDIQQLHHALNNADICLALPANERIEQWLAGEEVDFDCEHLGLTTELLPPYPFDTTEYHVQKNQKQITKARTQTLEMQACIEVLCEVLSYQSNKLDMSKSLAELGIDSLSALNVLTKLKERGYVTSADKVWSAPTVRDFAHELTPPQHEEANIDIPGMRKKKRNGLVWLYSSGDGPILILLPPLNSDYKAWMRQIPMLLQLNYQLYIPYYPGHEAQAMEEPLVLAELAMKIADFAFSLSQKAHFIGWSLGGILSILIAVAHKSLIKSMTLIACTTQFDESLFEKTVEMQNDLKSKSELLKIAFQTDQSISDYISCNTSMTILKDYYQELINLSINQEALCAINIPTQIILGKQDPVINEQQIERLKKIPHQALTVFKHAGHFIPITSAAEFNSLLLSFVTLVEDTRVEEHV